MTNSCQLCHPSIQGNKLQSFPHTCLVQSPLSNILLHGAILDSSRSYRSSILLAPMSWHNLAFRLYPGILFLVLPSASLSGARAITSFMFQSHSTEHTVFSNCWWVTKHLNTPLNYHSNVGYLLTFVSFFKFGTKLSPISVSPTFTWLLQWVWELSTEFQAIACKTGPPIAGGSPEPFNATGTSSHFSFRQLL